MHTFWNFLNLAIMSQNRGFPTRLPQDAKDKIHDQMTFVHLIHNHHIKVIHLGGSKSESLTKSGYYIDKQNIESMSFYSAVYM